MKPLFAFIVCAALLAAPVRASEADAVALSNTIQQRHLPNGLLLDPQFAAPDSNEIVVYTRGADAAIWTGHYLAAESYRYQVTKAPDALANVKRALAGLRLLAEVTGNGLLARCAFPSTWKYAASVIEEERRHGIYYRVLNGDTYVWIGNTSRDQYSGVFFGLGVAYDLVEDAQVRAEIKTITTKLLDYLLDKNWLVTMPGGEISTTFTGHPEQRLSFLAVGRRVNAGFASDYELARFFASLTVGSAIFVEVLEEHDSYFKFNLATINLFNLLRLENDTTYRNRYLDTYNVLRRTTDDHGNAHFNMLDRAIRGTADVTRDEATRQMLNDWLKRPRRDVWLDWRTSARFAACGADRACAPLPIVDRITTDFLWQRSPFLLWGGGYGTIEGAGIDYLLPYWMARYYGVIQEYQAPKRNASTGATGLPTRSRNN
ncbi:MAG: hypothetical protein HYR56_25030 [Acidobacteria bacterium]|nr:hypothetical protein [Acidobacteriota bacterium]MBI3424124.1 hypothetical protein [Acidobacteriota bacterium]